MLKLIRNSSNDLTLIINMHYTRNGNEMKAAASFLCQTEGQIFGDSALWQLKLSPRFKMRETT